MSSTGSYRSGPFTPLPLPFFFSFRLDFSLENRTSVLSGFEQPSSPCFCWWWLGPEEASEAIESSLSSLPSFLLFSEWLAVVILSFWVTQLASVHPESSSFIGEAMYIVQPDSLLLNPSAPEWFGEYSIYRGWRERNGHTLVWRVHMGACSTSWLGGSESMANPLNY